MNARSPRSHYTIPSYPTEARQRPQIAHKMLIKFKTHAYSSTSTGEKRKENMVLQNTKNTLKTCWFLKSNNVYTYRPFQNQLIQVSQVQQKVS